MTQKELLYVEDAINHENNVITYLEDAINNFQDEDLVSFVEKEVKKHQNMIDKLINALEDKSNE